MITVMVPTRNDEVALARMLPPLVHELVHGPVSDVLVYDDGSTDQTAKVCDIAGCTMIDARTAPLAEAIEAARGTWLLFLPPGALLAAGWSAHVAEYIESQQGHGAPAVFRVATDPNRPWWQRFVIGNRQRHPLLPRGYLVSRRHARTVLGHGGTLADLIRGRAVRKIRAEIHMPLRVAFER